LRLALRIAGLGVESVLDAARSLLSGVGKAQLPPRNPYVQNVSTTSAVIAWASDEPNAGFVEYGETPQLGRREFDARIGKRHAVTLSDLSPGSTYHYRVTGVGGTSVTASFRTAPTGDDSRFTFAVIGDSGHGGKNQLAIARLLERLEPDLILHTGDVIYPSGEDRHYDPRFFMPYRDIIKGVPVFPVLGNHDVEKDNGAAYLKNFYLPSNDPQNTGRYYSFDWGNAHFVALDSELYYEDGGGSHKEQKAWLERDLSVTHRPWKFVFFHRPIYSSSEHGSDEKVRKDLEPILRRHGVDLVFSGHDHNYERTVPIHGVIYIVTGGGGRNLYEAGRSEWTAFSKSTHHAVLTHINGEHLSLKAVEPDGTIVDCLDFSRL
jgi:predicted phosphodiesterase